MYINTRVLSDLGARLNSIERARDQLKGERGTMPVKILVPTDVVDQNKPRSIPARIGWMNDLNVAAVAVFV